MAIPSTGFSMRTVQLEFGTFTEQSLSPKSLQTYLTAIFGGWSVGDKLSKFGGYGQPSLSSISVTNGSGQRDVTFNFTLNTGNLGSTVVIRRADNVSFSSGVITVATLNFSSSGGGSKSESYTMPDYSTTYYFKLYVYNNFNSHSNDWNIYPSPTNVYSVTTGAEPTLTPPSIYDEDLILDSGARYKIRLFFNVGSVEPTSYSTQVRINGGSWFSVLDSNLVNISGNSWRIDLSSTNLMFSGGESVDVELTASRPGYQSTTGSTSFTAEALQPPINPTVSQPSSTSAQVQLSFSRDDLSSGTDVGVNWYRNGSYHSQDTITNGANSISKTFSDGDTIYARVRYLSGLDTTWNTSNTVTVNVVQQPTVPTDVQIASYSPEGFEVTWSAPSSGPTPDRYRIQWSVDDFNTTYTATTTSTSFTETNICSLTGASGLTNVRARVRSEMVGGQSSNYVEAVGFVLVQCPF